MRLVCNGNFIIKFKDRVLLSLYYFIFKFGPEYSLQYTDYTAKIIGKSCNTLSIILLISLRKLPLVGRVLNLMINENDANASTKLKFDANDVLKGLLTACAVILFSIDTKANSQVNLHLALYGFLFILLGLFFDAIRGMKVMIINEEVNALKETIKSDQLKNEYFFIFNVGVVIIGSLGLLYQWFNSSLSDFIFANYHDRNLILFMANTIVCSSLCHYYNVSVLRDEGPISTSILSSFRKAFSIFLSIFIFRKQISLFKGLGLFIIISIVIYEVNKKCQKKPDSNEKTQIEIDSAEERAILKSEYSNIKDKESESEIIDISNNNINSTSILKS